MTLAPARPLVVVMGVSGSGKSTIGELLANSLDVPFLDADDLHPITNVDKMAAGVPLTDEDRWPWLGAVGKALAAADAEGTGLVVACSALKRAYRDAIREQEPRTVFVYLEGSQELLGARLSRREDHFMPAGLLDSQFAALDPLQHDEAGVVVGVEDAPQSIAATAEARLLAMR